MKKILFVLICLLSTAVYGQIPSEREKILSVLENQRLAWNKGNVEEYMAGYLKSDSLMFVGKSGLTYGWQNTLNNYKKGYPNINAMGHLSFDIKDVKLLGNLDAYVIGAWHIKRQSDELKGFFTLWLKKVNDQWFIVVDHSS